MTEKRSSCPVCGSNAFKTLPSPWASSMTTAGQLVPEPLAKAHCLSCGMLVRQAVRLLGTTDFYEKRYTFFERPGAAVFDKPRYEAMAAWIAEALDGFEPSSILDAGCGRGWMMRALRNRYPGAVFRGVEPSEQESLIARREGWSVDTAKVDEHYTFDRRYDLVYCTNVVEHTTDPVGFLAALRRLTAPGGRIVVTCPDASYPNAEFMFSDQNFSFTPAHLLRLAEAAGLYGRDLRPAPDVSSLRDKQLWVFVVDSEGGSVPSRTFRAITPDLFFSERAEYVLSYVRCDGYLEESVRGCRKVYNFGTSTWAMLLRAYCPSYWQRVTSCVIDGGCGEFQGKPVEDFRSLRMDRDDALVLGVNPYAQAEFTRRLEAAGMAAPIGWSHIIRR